MAGIYIPGMETPTDHPLWIIVHADGTVEANEVSQARPVGWQTLRNAAVPVPPHGRLIDADAVFKRLQKQAMSVWGNGNPRYQIILDVMDAIRFAPTIIAAEEGA